MIRVKILQASQLQPGNCYKFITVDGQYRFSPFNNPEQCFHEDLKDDDELAETGGTIGVTEENWTMIQDYSLGLKVGTSRQTYADITKLLNRPERPKLAW